MCTVTFIPRGNADFVLTSNRDEAPDRETMPPEFHHSDETNMLFPKDKRAGGTWIGLSDRQRLICVLNGGFAMHERQANYRMSRGAVAKDVMVSPDITATIENYDLKDIEPFTMIIVEWKSHLNLSELVWDGETKHFAKLPNKPKLWSSSSLYNLDMKAERQSWFADFLSDDDITAESILEFHSMAGKGNDEYGVVMNRGFVKTTSRTQVEKSNDQVTMLYQDLDKNIMKKVPFEIPLNINE